MSRVIDQYCLALNRGWQPVSFYQLSVAIANVMRGQARVMVPETYALVSFEDWIAEERPVERQIKTPSGFVPAPEIIVLTQYAKMPPMKVGFNSANLFKRDEHTCQFCSDQPKRLTIDHILPRSRGGATNWENCVTACSPCNSRKADRLLAEAGMRLRRKPSKPTWKPGVRIPRGAAPASWRTFLEKVSVA